MVTGRKGRRGKEGVSLSKVCHYCQKKSLEEGLEALVRVVEEEWASYRDRRSRGCI